MTISRDSDFQNICWNCYLIIVIFELLIYSSVLCTDYSSTLPGARMHRINSQKAKILHLLTEELANPKR